jgi:thiol:disulfide interchange protein DsbC
MKKLFVTAFLGLAALLALPAGADTQAVERALEKALPGVKPDSVKASPVAGLFEVMVGPKLFYVSEDGRYLIQGSLIDIQEKKNLTEDRESEARLNALAKVGNANMVAFRPKTPKHLVYVFTDIDCGYCRKLHSEMDQYQKENIEIRYLFFPRAGKGSESYKKAVSVWCAKDRNEALTKAKKGENIERKECDNPVDEHMALGDAMGASGTPMIVTEKGGILPGYVPAAQLSRLLAAAGDGQNEGPKQK